MTSPRRAANKVNLDNIPRRGMRAVGAHRVPLYGGALTETKCWVVEENMLSIEVEGVGAYLLMWTPTEPVGETAGYTHSDGVMAESGGLEALALTVGFCLSEEIIASRDDIRSIAICPDAPSVVKMQLVDPSRAIVRRRDVKVTSSCGLCGSHDGINGASHGLSQVPDSLRLKGDQLGRLVAMMRERQPVFRLTGGAHAAAAFAPNGRIVAVAEDLGRHNALDKVIGLCLLQKPSLSACGVVLSSRLSFEMVVKAVRAGFELVVAVSAPTALAIETARRYGVTLCGFVRDGEATIYSHPKRIRDI